MHLLHNDGYRRLTMEGIAREAGVSKQTVYRWWTRKAEIVLEAVLEGAETAAAAPDTGSVEGDLRTFLRSAFRASSTATTRVLTALMAEAQLDEEFAAAFRAEFLAQRRRALREVFRRGVARGELSRDADPEFLAEVVFGVVWYRMLGGHAALDRKLADRLTDFIVQSPKLRP